MSWGGMEMYTLHTSALLRGTGNDVELLCISGSRLESEAAKGGFLCHAVDSKYFNFKNIYRIARLVKERNYDIIHAEASKDLWFIVPALLISVKKIPLLLTKHVGSNIIKKDMLHKILYKRVDLALAISEVIKTNLIETTPLQDDKIELLHDSIDASRFDPEKIDNKKIRKEFNIKEDEILIGMTGRFSPGKGHEEFLYAARCLLKKYNNLRFMIVGEASRGEDEYAKSIKGLAIRYGISNQVIFTGYRNDIPEILAALDIYIFPSHAEAFGLALVEAMSMELPTVCSSSDGVLDVAVEGITSYMFEPGEELELTRKVESLIKDPVKRKEFGREGRKRVLKKFASDIFTRQLIHIYEQQVKEKKSEEDLSS